MRPAVLVSLILLTSRVAATLYKRTVESAPKAPVVDVVEAGIPAITNPASLVNPFIGVTNGGNVFPGM